ncbi:MAG: hypothetical protein E6356_14275 [Terrisporobacter othiniensis]|nr:hypothetical protein [Terrisporobacter othiniensis]
MQERDMKILKFISDVRVCTNEDIQQVFFKGLSVNMCYRRLNHLIECKLIKRSYYNIDKNKNVYVYYLDKKPSIKILKHELLITKFLVNLINQGYEILEFEKSPNIADIIPDAMIKFKSSNDKIKHIFLEVQISDNNCIKKYYNIKSKVKHEIPNTLYIVTNQQLKDTKLRDLKVVIDDLNFNKVKFYFS